MGQLRSHHYGNVILTTHKCPKHSPTSNAIQILQWSDTSALYYHMRFVSGCQEVTIQSLQVKFTEKPLGIGRLNNHLSQYCAQGLQSPEDVLALLPTTCQAFRSPLSSSNAIQVSKWAFSVVQKERHM